MLKHGSRFLVWACFALAIALFALIGAFSPSYQKCTAEHKHDYGHNKQSDLYEPVANAARLLPMFLMCEGAFIDENGVTITALATIGIAAFTLTLWRATTEHGRISDKLLQLARDEFLASHRPELKIHSIRILEFDDSVAPDQQPLRVQFGVINAGTGAAVVTGSAVEFGYEYPDLRPYLPRLPRNDVIGLRRYDVGASDTIETVSDPDGGLDHVSEDIGKVLYLAGWVGYDDGRGHARTTFFCRQYMRDRNSFAPVDDPDCEATIV